MAQAPRPGIPPTPPQQPSAQQPSVQQPSARTQQVNIHGVAAPSPNMAPDEPEPEGLGDNTRAEMEAGKKNLAQFAKRHDAEHEAGRHANRARNPQGNDE
jgi:hypothetical protein